MTPVSAQAPIEFRNPAVGDHTPAGVFSKGFELENQIAIDSDNIKLQEALALANAAKLAQSDAVDMYRFTSILKTEMEENERLALIEDLWEMVYADGEIHEFEDNVVWRVAELIGIQSRERMVLKQRVLSRRDSEAARSGFQI